MRALELWFLTPTWLNLLQKQRPADLAQVFGSLSAKDRHASFALLVDPALASTMFITTITDVFGFLSFLGLGALFLRYSHPAG